MNEYKQILDRAARICSGSEKCSHDIKQKMILWGLGEEDAEKALAYLVENKFIDDRRYAGYFVRDKLRFNKWGRTKISFSLRQKNIDELIIEDCISEINPELYMEIIDEIIRNKMKSVGSIKIAANKAKVLRFAAQKGFTSSEIFDALDRIQK